MKATASTLIRRWLPVITWMAVIYLFSDQPYSDELTKRWLGVFDLAVRKLAHLCEYGILFCLVNRAFGHAPAAPVTPQKARRRDLLMLPRAWLTAVSAFTVCLLYAVFDEWHQSFVPGRSALIQDVLVDCLGAGLAWASSAGLSFLRTRREAAR